MAKQPVPEIAASEPKPVVTVMPSVTKGTEIAPFAIDGSMIVKRMAEVQRAAMCGDSEGLMCASYDLDTPEGIMLSEEMLCDTQQNGHDYVNVPLKICAFILHTAQFPGTDGEIVTSPLLTLRLTDGKQLNVFGHPGVRNFMHRLRSHYLTGPLSEQHPLSLILKSRKGDGEKSYWHFERPKE